MKVKWPVTFKAPSNQKSTAHLHAHRQPDFEVPLTTLNAVLMFNFVFLFVVDLLRAGAIPSE